MGKHNPRVELTQEADQIAWLARKGVQHGFTVTQAQASDGALSVWVTPNAKAFGTHPALRDGKRQMTFGGVTFDGVLRVVDKHVFRGSLESGIGPAKAYGFGLLSVAPAGGRNA